MRIKSYRALGLTLAALCALVLTGCMTSEKSIQISIQADYGVKEPEFRQSISHLLSAPIVESNRIDTLVNGDQIFPAMLTAISNAQKSITLEMYIWSNGELSQRFADALSERARAGVKVHVLVDGLGSSKLPRRSVTAMRKAGVHFAYYNYPHWWRFIKRMNHRTHRKTMVVDGKIGFAGGACIHDDWQGDAEGLPFWRDNHYRIEGPVVSQMQAVFMDNWVRMRGRVLHGEDYFPETPPAGNIPAQFFLSGPHQGTENARLNYLLSIAAAQDHIRLGHSYFVPDSLTMKALFAARKRGVKIEVIVPGPLDAGVVKAAARPRWIELMDAGVEFYEYQQTLYHCKLFVVDDAWVSAGSCNFDHRSLRINDEANFNALDPDFAAEQIRLFEMDKAKSRRMSAADLKRRNVFLKLHDRFWGIFAFML